MFATALNQSVWNGTRVFAPMLATAPIAIVGSVTGDFRLGAAVALYLIAAGFAAMAIVIVTIRLPEMRRATGRTVLHDIADGLRFVVLHRIFLLLLMMSFSIGYFGLSYQWLLPAFAADQLGLEADGLGLLHTASGIGGLIGIFLSASFGQQQSRAWMLGGGAGLLGLSVLLFGINGEMQWYWLALAMAAASGGLYAVFQTASNTLLNLAHPDRVPRTRDGAARRDVEPRAAGGAAGGLRRLVHEHAVRDSARRRRGHRRHRPRLRLQCAGQGHPPPRGRGQRPRGNQGVMRNVVWRACSAVCYSSSRQ